MSELLRTALKEWAAVDSAVASGDQLVLVRKGGIAEKRFELPSSRFLLYPTQFHQPENQFRSGFAHHVKVSSPAPDSVTLKTWAEAVKVYRVDDLETLINLTPWVIFTEQTIRDRYAFRPRQAMHVIALRAFRLPAPATVPLLDEYSGCRSWLELRDPVDTAGSAPVLDSRQLAQRIEELDQLLGS